MQSVCVLYRSLARDQARDAAVQLYGASHIANVYSYPPEPPAAAAGAEDDHQVEVVLVSPMSPVMDDPPVGMADISVSI